MRFPVIHLHHLPHPQLRWYLNHQMLLMKTNYLLLLHCQELGRFHWNHPIPTVNSNRYRLFRLPRR